MTACWHEAGRADSEASRAAERVEEPDANQNEPMAEQFARHGVGPERLVFVSRRRRRHYLDLYNRADLGLDPFPYNAA